MNPVATESKIAHTIVIKDNGPGIPEADINKKFQPFIHLEVSRNKKTGGIGLELAITRSIIRDHDGNVVARSKPEGG